MKYARTTRFLHAGIALGVSIQLFTSLLMEIPEPGLPFAEPGHRYFLVHRWSGICVAALVLLHWLWNLSGHVMGGWGHLFPWFSRARRRALISNLKEVPGWFRGKLPDQRQETVPLAGAVHGLGLLAVSAMAASGTTIFFAMGPHGSMGALADMIMVGHALMGNIIWVYFCGHVGISLLHQLQGDRLITSMFNLSGKRQDDKMQCGKLSGDAAEDRACTK